MGKYEQERTIRRRLVEALHADLIGPFVPADRGVRPLLTPWLHHWSATRWVTLALQ